MIKSNLSVRTPLHYGQFPMSRKNSHVIFSSKKTRERVNSYKLLYYGHCGDQVKPESRSGESAQGETRLADVLCKVISKAKSLYIQQRFAKGVQRNITDFFKAWITTDSIKIFSITFGRSDQHFPTKDSEGHFHWARIALRNVTTDLCFPLYRSG